jgi:predicted nucleic acid-binding Zn ribbon protein
MTAPAPETCDVCGAAPVELVLYPVAIHYKGSGFYTTDYGKKETKEKKEDSKPAAESKPAESKPKPSSTSSD